MGKPCDARARLYLEALLKSETQSGEGSRTKAFSVSQKHQWITFTEIPVSFIMLLCPKLAEF